MLVFLYERFYYNESISSELKYSFWIGSFITLLLVLVSSFQTNFTRTDVLFFSVSVVFASIVFQYALHKLIIKFGWHKQWLIKYEVLKVIIHLLLIAIYLFVVMTFLGLVSTTIVEFSLFVGITGVCGVIPISIKTLWTQNARLTKKLKSRTQNQPIIADNELFLVSPTKSDSFSCEVANLLFLKSDENYLIAVEKNKKTHIRLTMKSAIEQLDNNLFLRVHRSYLVNSKFIEKVKSKHLILVGSIQVPISRQFRKVFVEEQMKIS